MLRNVFALIGISLLCVAGSVQAQTQTPLRNMQKEAMIWDQLGAIAPESVETFKAATTALDSDKYDEAERLYRDVYKKAPEFDPVVRRLGISLVLQGNLHEGMSLLEKAVTLNRSSDNLSALGQYLAYPGNNKQGTAEDKARALALLKEAVRTPQVYDDGYDEVLLAQLALDNDDVATFREATNKISVSHPEMMATHYFKAILAAYDQSWLTADNEIKEAERLGLSHDEAQAFLDSGVHTRATAYRLVIYAAIAVVGWIVGLLLLFLLGRFMSKRTLRFIEEDDPNAVASASELSLRKIYRQLINVAGLYYYISIPFVILTVMGIAGLVTYAAFAAGQIPIKLIAIIDIGAVVTSYKMIRSLFIKIQRDDPGRPLTYEEAPGLWDLTRAVAGTLKTRPVDEIRMTPGTDVAVYERGSRRERASDQARRILLLGAGVLNDFELNGFRAVLAHEYGHFSHRDTAGGDVALRVNEEIVKFARAMVLSGQNVWWNLAFQFLRIYDFIFRRISHGATRLQEVLADRVAAAKYGAQTFEQGLTHIIQKTAEFSVAANHEIKSSATAGRALQNLYELTSAGDEAKVAAEKSLTRETTEDDTHPGPQDRFRLTKRITSPTEPPISGMVWDLFRDRAALMAEMTAVVEDQLKGY